MGKRYTSLQYPAKFMQCPKLPDNMYWSVQPKGLGMYIVALHTRRKYWFDKMNYHKISDSSYYHGENIPNMLRDATPGLLRCWETESKRTLIDWIENDYPVDR